MRERSRMASHSLDPLLQFLFLISLFLLSGIEETSETQVSWINLLQRVKDGREKKVKERLGPRHCSALKSQGEV